MNKKCNIKEIKDLPKVYQQIYKSFLNQMSKNNAEQARVLLRPILEFYTCMEYEIPEELEVQYARLYVKELKTPTENG